MKPDLHPRPSRRDLLGGAGLLGVASLLGSRSQAQTLWTPDAKPIVDGLSKPNFGVPSPACTLTPSVTEGPYYFNASLLRRDISDGKPGFPLQLTLNVIQASTCAPIPNAIVDIWHCDLNGIYSGYAGQLNNLDSQGDNDFRGVQVTDANGAATFLSVFPGWYPGRTIHIHFKVYLTATAAITSQLFFTDAIADEILGAADLYTLRGTRPTRNANDGIYSPQLVVATTPHKGGIAASFTIVVA